MKTLLVPVDFSGATRALLSTVEKLATPGAKVFFLHSLTPPLVTTDYGVGVEMLHETIALARKTAEQQLMHLVKTVEARGFKAQGILENGPAAPAIIEVARKRKVDAIVLGAHGHTALYNLIIGSTTQAVLKKATCPVVVVPPAATKAKATAKK
ncbi:universal stress protein [Opitutaceae bacterium TAV4]|uniref:universal stress protein n=1 Tax=Geminisphaera colitermitum TaxID=1148786 RepID=UPI000158D04D|nr:universal stress protein [Geminisphaera colitermitum]RRJ97669.1 universal stress protein [Opitutaceae bacterium TAV4]RRK02209.1 universal stress protein [Opitutaceae bacterium TAV3]